MERLKSLLFLLKKNAFFFKILVYKSYEGILKIGSFFTCVIDNSSRLERAVDKGLLAPFHYLLRAIGGHEAVGHYEIMPPSPLPSAPAGCRVERIHQQPSLDPLALKVTKVFLAILAAILLTIPGFVIKGLLLLHSGTREQHSALQNHRLWLEKRADVTEELNTERRPIESFFEVFPSLLQIFGGTKQVKALPHLENTHFPEKERGSWYPKFPSFEEQSASVLRTVNTFVDRETQDRSCWHRINIRAVQGEQLCVFSLCVVDYRKHSFMERQFPNGYHLRIEWVLSEAPNHPLRRGSIQSDEQIRSHMEGFFGEWLQKLLKGEECGPFPLDPDPAPSTCTLLNPKRHTLHDKGVKVYPPEQLDKDSKIE
jgi:hypothetical protein